MLLEVGRHLLFFDKDGNELNLTRTYGVWYGMLYFPRVSTSLHEVQNVFITEQVKYEDQFSQSIDLDILPVGQMSTMMLSLYPDPSEAMELRRIFKSGQNIHVYSTSDPSNYFVANIHGYNSLSGELDIRVIGKFGSGVHNSWKLETFVYTFPRGDNNSYFSFRWLETESNDNIFLFKTETVDSMPLIKKMESADVILVDGTNDDIEGVTFSGSIPIAVDSDATLFRIIEDGTSIDSRVMQMNIALTSEEESRYARTLEIYYNNLAVSTETTRQTFLASGNQNQKYFIDVNPAFDQTTQSFEVYVAQRNSGIVIDSSSNLTIGDMSLTFKTSNRYNSENRLKAGGTIFVMKTNNSSEMYFAKVVYSEHDPSNHTTTVYIEDNQALSEVLDITQYRILFRDSDIVPMTIVDNQLGYSYGETIVEMNRDNATELSFRFGKVNNGYTPPQGSVIVIEQTPIENSQKIAEIAFYGEVEGEDERFKVLLNNFGRDIVPDVGPVFRESDVYETMPDFQIINTKRKELLATGEEIFPYMGSYRGFINAIKFFGYGDLRLKEYWKNIDIQSTLYDKYRHVEVPLDLRTKIQDELVPTQSWKKTNKFSLFYDINRLTGSYDEFGQPITEDVFEFTNDEILIKLFSLKNVLKKYFLPLNARIVDITGEGSYFETYAFETWFTQNEIITATPDYLNIKFSVEPEISYIEDLGTGYKLDDTIGDGVTIRDVTEYSINDLRDYELRSFYVNKSTSRFLDDAQTKIGAKVTLKAETFSVTWKDMTSKWSLMKSAHTSTYGGQYSWGGLAKGDAYDMEWRVVSDSTNIPYQYIIRGTLEELTTHEVIVPYEGVYDVTLAYYLTSNGTQSKKKTSAFQVLMKSSNIVGVYRASNKIDDWNELKGTWSTGSYSWGDRNQGVYRPVRRRRNANPQDEPLLFKRTTWQQAVVRWEDTGVSRYLQNSEIPDVTSVQLKSIDYTRKNVRIEGNYYDPDIPIANTIVRGQYVVFKGPENREGYNVVEYNPQQKTLSVSGEHPASSIEDKFVAIISRKTVKNLTFTALTQDLENQGYRPVYYMSVSGDVTSHIKSGQTLEYMLPNQSEYSEAYIRFSYYSASTGNTNITIESLDYRTFNFDVSERDDNVHINQLAGCSIRYFDFVTRLIPGSITPYSGRTTIFFSDPTGTMSSLPDPSDSSNEVIAYWGNVSEDIALYVSNVYYDGTDTIISLEDPNNLLSRIDVSYSVNLASFDVDNATKWYGVDAVKTWSSATTTWSSAFSRTWGSFEYHGSYICGFIINNVAPGGTIRVDSGELFEFPDDQYLTLGGAIESLKTSKIEGISKFNYTIAKYDESLGLVRVLPFTFSIEENNSYNSYDIGGIYFVTPLEDTSGSISLSRSSVAKVVYVGVNNQSRPTFRVLSVGTMQSDGEYSGRNFGKVQFYECFGDYCSIVEASDIGSTNYDGIVSIDVVSSCDGNNPNQEDPYASQLYGFWPYYVAGGYVVDDGYFLNENSTTSSVGQTINFDFGVDISSLPYFEIGREIKIKKKDESDTIVVTISDAPYFDAISSQMIIPIEYSSEYGSLVDVEDYRVFFTEWAEINNPISYDPVQQKDVYTQPEYFILATAKVPGSSALCYMEYGSGVYGSDPEFPTRGNSYPLYNFREETLTDDMGSYNPLDYSVLRAWQEGGFAYPPVKHFNTCAKDATKLLQGQYGPYLNGSFSWADTYIGYDHVDAPTFSTIFFSLANCQIPGAVSVIWTLTDSKSGVDLIKTKSKNFVWTFKDEGYYNVSATIIDINNNTRDIEKYGFVKVFDSYKKLEYEGCPID